MILVLHATLHFNDTIRIDSVGKAEVLNHQFQ